MPARLRWILLVLTVLVASLFVTWRLLAAFDFAYPWLHGLLDIEATVAEYAPRNEQRRGFERTDVAEHARLFGAIVDAVRDHGTGLDGIIYRTPEGEPLGRLLTAAEIQHLQDVARLVSAFERLGWMSLVLAIALGVAAGLRRERPPSPIALLSGFGVVIAAGTAVVFLLGPVEVFYWLHTRVFPPDHQWFFWYEESLMSTLMQAPNLFGAIAVIWLVPALLLAAGLLAALIHYLDRRAGPG
ncbi:MAG: DUF1461 domain-containing protein [Halofilum sp. (in: g-proteobacteria)]|nr:DUF1461 domain-containing protein [Halofilum sp. (in: g-proteobacteria)]